MLGEGGVVALSEVDLVIRLSRARLGVLRLGQSLRVLGLRATRYCVMASARRPPSYFADLIEPAS